jgi:DNA-binding MarR family transcriptional regulator
MYLEKESSDCYDLGQMVEGLKAHLPVCVCGTLRQVTRAITQVYDDALRPSGLRAMQLQMLMTVRHLGEVTVTELGVVMTMDQTTLTRSLSLLERQGWLERRVRKDRRVRAFGLTDEGLRVVQGAEPLWAEVQQRVLAQLGEGAWQDARRLLGSLLELPASSAKAERL